MISLLILQIVSMVLKLTEVIKWSWGVMLIPLWIWIVFGIKYIIIPWIDLKRFEKSIEKNKKH